MNNQRLALRTFGISAALVVATAGCPAQNQTLQKQTAPTQAQPTAVAPALTTPTAQPAPTENGPPVNTATVKAPPPQELTFPDDAFRAKQPAAAKPRPLRIPRIKTFKLSNGIRAYLVERHELPKVSIELNFDGGSINDPAGKEGMASVCMDLMSEGTQELEKIAFNEALADIAASVSSSAGLESQSVSMSSLSAQLDKAFALFRATLLEPRMSQGDFERIVKQRLESLKQAKGSVGAIAGRVSDLILYGEKHAFGRLVTDASLQSLTNADCVAYHAAYIKPKNARLFVVGDMTEKQIRAKFGKKALPTWKGAPKRSVRLTRPKSKKGKIFFVNVDGAKQSQIYFMHFGPKRKARDYFATSQMSKILGGGFTSRLNMNLREDKGYSYGARGGLSYSRNYGEFRARSSVRSDATWQSIKEIYGEIKGLHSGKKPATKAELERETSASILSLPARFATGAQVLGAYRSLVYFGLPLNYFDSYVKKINKVKLKQVQRSAKKYLKPNRAIILVVGDAKSLQTKREGGKDVPLLDKNGAPVTLLFGLQQFVADKTFGKGSLVTLDADGKPVSF